MAIKTYLIQQKFEKLVAYANELGISLEFVDGKCYLSHKDDHRNFRVYDIDKDWSVFSFPPTDPIIESEV